jgi:hypothetical protein
MGKIDKKYSPLLKFILENMFKQDPKERWGYNDLA